MLNFKKFCKKFKFRNNSKNVGNEKFDRMNRQKSIRRHSDNTLEKLKQIREDLEQLKRTDSEILSTLTENLNQSNKLYRHNSMNYPIGFSYRPINHYRLSKDKLTTLVDDTLLNEKQMQTFHYQSMIDVSNNSYANSLLLSKFIPNIFYNQN